MSAMMLASGLLFGRAHFLHWGVIQISLANFLVIVLMLMVFRPRVGASIPARRRRRHRTRGRAGGGPMTMGSQSRSSSTTRGQAGSRSWTVGLRDRLGRTVPAGQLLPDRQPVYVRSWIYVFGVASLAAFVYVIASGLVLTLKGPDWWHDSAAGHFVNSTHLWSVELFFFFMVIHLWGKFFMAAWRGRRALTWITGAVAFLGSIGAAFTGYLVQSNFDSQWISTQAKDGLNSVGDRIGVQRAEHRPDAVVARHDAPAPGRCARRAPRHPGPQARRRAALRRRPPGGSPSGPDGDPRNRDFNDLNRGSGS